MISGGKVTTPWYTSRVPTWPGVSSPMNWENLFEVPIGPANCWFDVWKLFFWLEFLAHPSRNLPGLIRIFVESFGVKRLLLILGVAKIQWNKSLWKREIVEAHPFSQYLHMEPASLFESKRNLLVLRVDSVCVRLNTLTSAEMALDFSWNGTIGWETIAC